MSFTLSHIFEGNLEELQNSPEQLEGKIKWYLRLQLKDGNIDITLFGVPLEGFVRPEVYWKILADVEGTIGTTKILNKKCTFYYDETKKFSYYGTVIFEQEKKLFLENEKIVEDGKISVNLKIGKITTEGIRDFKLLDFSDSNLSKSDLALSIGKQKLFCHSQFLSVWSPVFDKILEENDYSKEEPLKIELDSEMSVEDFKEFLHQLYSAAEPIREDNWEILLHFAGKYEVSSIIFCCEKFLLGKLLETDSSEMKMKAIEMFPVSCRYGMENMKMKCLDCLFPIMNLSKLTNVLKNKHYLEMGETMKLELWEKFILQARTV